MKTSCIHLLNKHNHSESYPPEHFFLETTFKICKDSSKTHGSEEGSQTLSYLIFTICSKFGGFEFCRVITFFEFLLVSSLVVVVKVPRKCLVNIRFFVLKTSFFHLHSSWKTAYVRTQDLKSKIRQIYGRGSIICLKFDFRSSQVLKGIRICFRVWSKFWRSQPCIHPKNRAPAQIKRFLVLKCVINQILDFKLGLQI